MEGWNQFMRHRYLSVIFKNVTSLNIFKVLSCRPSLGRKGVTLAQWMVELQHRIYQAFTMGKEM